MSKRRPVKVIVRDARATDLDSMIALARARLPIAVPTLEDTQGEAEGILAGDFAGRAGYSFLVAMVGADLAGFAVTFPFSIPGGDPGENGWESEAGNLGFIAASAEFAGRGIGHELLRNAAARRRQANGYLMVAHVPLVAASLYERAGWTVLPRERGYAWQSPTSGLLLADWADDPEPFVHLAYKKLRPLEIEFTFDHIEAPPVGRAIATAIMGRFEGVFDPETLSPIARQQFDMTTRYIRSQLD